MTDLKTYNASAAIIAKFWTGAGLTLPQACGLLAQADAESSLDPKAQGDKVRGKPTAFGLDQWHPSRVAAIREGCGVDLSKLPPLADQLKAALWELQHTEHVAWTKIKATHTAFDAGYAAAKYWERPGAAAQYVKRGNRAEVWLMYFEKHPLT